MIIGSLAERLHGADCVPVAALDDLIEARRTPREPGARKALELLLRIREARRAADR